MAKKKSAKARPKSVKGSSKKVAKKAKPSASNSEASKKPSVKAKASKKNQLTKKEQAKLFGTFPTEIEELRACVLPVSNEFAYTRARLAMLHELESLRQRPGFLFADVGYKFKHGQRTDFVAVRIHVTKKSDDQDCIGKTCYNELVPTDVIVSNFRRASSKTDAGSLVRSNGAPGEFGTLGMGVRRSLTNKVFFLTCAHVLSETQPPKDVENILFDTANNPVGLSSNRRREFFRFDGNFDLALLLPSSLISNSDCGRFVESLPQGVSPPNRIGRVTDADLNRAVYKIGAKVPHVYTKGYIDSIETTPIPIKDSPDAIDHVVIRSTVQPGQFAPIGGSFANQGDSGSIVFMEDGTVIGMVRAVYDDNKDNEGDRAVVTRMSNIETAFHIEMIP